VRIAYSPVAWVASMLRTSPMVHRFEHPRLWTRDSQVMPWVKVLMTLTSVISKTYSLPSLPIIHIIKKTYLFL
jgi:hypothetical protein